MIQGTLIISKPVCAVLCAIRPYIQLKSAVSMLLVADTSAGLSLFMLPPAQGTSISHLVDSVSKNKPVTVAVCVTASRKRSHFFSLTFSFVLET